MSDITAEKPGIQLLYPSRLDSGRVLSGFANPNYRRCDDGTLNPLLDSCFSHNDYS